MGSETILELLYRVAIAGNAPPDESFLVLSYLAMAVFAALAAMMLLSNHLECRRRRALPKPTHVIMQRYLQG